MSSGFVVEANSVVRIGIPVFVGSAWTGGHNYIRNLCFFAAQHLASGIRMVLLVSEGTGDEYTHELAQIPGIELVKIPAQGGKSRAVASAKNFLIGRDADLAKATGQYDIDLLFESSVFLGRRPGVPVLAWIPDLQHKRLPEMFSWRTRIQRDLRIWAQIRYSRTLLLSSYSAESDLLQHFPAAKGRTTVARFAIQPTELSEVCDNDLEAYSLPARYLYVPNQLWKHKNHERLLRAVALARTRVQDLFVVATGNPSDVRFPDYPGRLQELEETLGIEENYRFLGLVPYGDVVALMQRCLALVNPSLCEGWSTTVEEAHAYGVPLVLSDIDVHKEQTGEEAIYFDPYSVDAIAEALVQAWRRPERPEKEGPATVETEASNPRIDRFVNEFSAAVDRALTGTD